MTCRRAAAWTGLGLVVMAAGCGNSHPKLERKYETVVRRDLKLTIEATGAVKPLSEVPVKSKGSGRVISIDVPTGSPVKKGDVLVVLDPAEEQLRLRQFEAQYERSLGAQGRAQAQREDLQRQTEAGARLRDRQITSEDAYKTLLAQLHAAEADVAVARAEVKAAGAALEEERVRFQDTVLRSPIDGVLIDRFVEPGAIISSGITNLGGGTDVVLVADLSALRVVADVDEVDIGSLRVGQKASVRVDAYRDRSFPGVVTSLASRGQRREAGITVFGCEIRIEDPEALERLKPEMTATAEIETEVLSQALALPLLALIYGEDGWVVKMEKPGSQELEDRPVKIGRDDGRWAQILEGVKEGDRVVIFSQSEREREDRLVAKKKRMFGF